MCGIVGILNVDASPVIHNDLLRMTDSISHRGPDGYGVRIFGQVGIGHRRLSIIDPVGGQQPLSNEDESIWITYNGELYNYLDLRHHLEGKGHKFRTNSDTETIIHAYEEWGDDCVERFRGMFAFAMADFNKQRLFLARDHLGIKPLYYLINPNLFAFASEIQAFHCIPNLHLKLDLVAVDQYLWLQYIPAPRTVFRNVYKLEPAQHLSITFDGRIQGPRHYWQLEFCPDTSKSEKEWIESLDAILHDSIKAHLISDVPFGAFLSGGVDSSAVVAYMSLILEEPVRTFSIGFDESEFNELEYANFVSMKWGTEHHIEIVKPDALSILPQLVKHYGEPFGDSSAVPTYYVSRMARRYVPMVLSGDGGDESFAGYDSYRKWMGWLAYDDVAMPLWKKALRPLAHSIMPNRYPSRKPNLEKWLAIMAYFNIKMRLSLWRPEFSDLPSLQIASFEEAFRNASAYSPSSKVQYMDLKSYLPYDILNKVDIASMMHGLEVRTPFADVKVVEFAASIPESLNIRKNERGKWEGKKLLKNVLSRFYPSKFLDRPKMGFSMPRELWFQREEKCRQKIREDLLGTDSLLVSFFVPGAIRQIVESSGSGQVWVLLVLEEWLKQNQAYICW